MIHVQAGKLRPAILDQAVPEAHQRLMGLALFKVVGAERRGATFRAWPEINWWPGAAGDRRQTVRCCFRLAATG